MNGMVSSALPVMREVKVTKGVHRYINGEMIKNYFVIDIYVMIL